MSESSPHSVPSSEPRFHLRQCGGFSEIEYRIKLILGNTVFKVNIRPYGYQIPFESAEFCHDLMDICCALPANEESIVLTNMNKHGVGSYGL